MDFVCFGESVIFLEQRELELEHLDEHEVAMISIRSDSSSHITDPKYLCLIEKLLKCDDL
jgi:hypothetical protein